MFIEAAVKEYIYEIQIRNYTSRTIKGYKNNILRFNQYIKKQFQITELEEVCPTYIKQYLNSLKEKRKKSCLYKYNSKEFKEFF